MMRRKLRRLYMVEAEWPDGHTMSRCYQERKAAQHKVRLWSDATYRLGAAKTVRLTESYPVVWTDEP